LESAWESAREVGSALTGTSIGDDCCDALAVEEEEDEDEEEEATAVVFVCDAIFPVLIMLPTRLRISCARAGSAFATRCAIIKFQQSQT
jgi:hypothetical protein